MSSVKEDSEGRGPSRREASHAHWRSLDEYTNAPEFHARLREKFPHVADATPVDRRRYLQLMAASLALSGLEGCGPEAAERQRWPYVEPPSGIVAGQVNTYATATVLDGFGTGVLVKHEMGRPLKVEGNSDHPASLGSSSAIDQASILDLYDPQRAQSIKGNGQISSWQDFITMMIANNATLRERRGDGLRLLMGTVTSPTLHAQIVAVQRAFPEMRLHCWQPLDRDNLIAGSTLAFGRAVESIYDLSRADVILGIESDLLSGAPGHLRYARDFAERRRASEIRERMSRVYAFEPTPTLFGAKADHRLALDPQVLRTSLQFVAASLSCGPEEWAHVDIPNRGLIDALIADMRAHRGGCLVHAGREQSADIHAIAHAINHGMNCLGHTVRQIEPFDAPPSIQPHSLADLVEDMAAGHVSTLIMFDVNAAYAAPADADFANALRNVPRSVYVGSYADETAAVSRWHIPSTHFFEAWGDVRAFDGTVTIQQPQTRPLYGGHSAHQILALLLDETQPDDLALLRDHWRHTLETATFEDDWINALRTGTVPKTQSPNATVTMRTGYAAVLPRFGQAAATTLLFRPDIALWDGRFAENAWLQELARPFTRLTWDNAALIAPAFAQKLGLTDGDFVEIAQGSRRLSAPVLILPGQATHCITLPLGYGRTSAGPIGDGVGFNAYALRETQQSWTAYAHIKRLDRAAHEFAQEQHQAIAEGRELVREGSLAAFLADPQSFAYPTNTETLYPEYRYEGVAWAMSINLNACIGCQACVAACQAENNIPVVGKKEVERGRIMHWLRIDRYYAGDLDNPRTAFQPVPCMHCEQAPCEVVCPVQATVHDHEGLNVMVYNRCVGTRFCSNNCPYKVRRFNWFDYSGRNERPRASWNPDVTVRERGVMEKCTYCVQRTRKAMISADKENRPIKDGEVVTACQQACPTKAIVFGDRNDKASAVAARKASPLDYALMAELNTRPRTTYEMLITNANPDIKSD